MWIGSPSNPGLWWLWFAVLAAMSAFLVIVGVLSFILPLLAALALLALRLAGRKPWKIVASTSTHPHETRAGAVLGTDASARAVDQIAERIMAGEPPETLNPGPPVTP